MAENILQSRTAGCGIGWKRVITWCFRLSKWLIGIAIH